MFHKLKLVSFLAASTAMLIACGSEPPPVSTEVPRVKYFEVGETTAGQLRRLSGKLVSEDTASLSFTVSGTVENVLVVQGQDVARSQVLARLDPEPTQIAVNQARAQVSIMRAQHLEAEQNYQRISDLFTRGYSTKAEREAAEAEYAQAGGNLAAAESDLERSERDLVRTELIAPFAGSIGSRSVEPFQKVAVGEEVFVLQSDQALKVEVLVPETLIRHVEYGQPVEIEFPSLDEEVLRGQVNEIGSRAASGNAFPVSVQLFSTTPELRVGMTAGVTFNFDNYLDGAPIYLIPISSLAIDYGTVNLPINPDNDAHVAVFVIGEGNVLEVRKIIVNGLRGDMFEVFKGLKPGDKVVSAGVSFVREGMKVELWSPEMGLKRG